MSKRVRVPVKGGLVKSIKTGDGAGGTTLAGYDSTTLTVAELQQILGISTLITRMNQVQPSGSGAAATPKTGYLVPGPGLGGGGALTGAVPLNLTGLLGALMGEDGEPGEMGPPGAGGSGGAAVAGSYMLPLVNGDLPGPSLMADSSGQCIGVPLS
ncbi:MAG: hypothetical protein KGL39_09735 [Patescibacteria group bacterium]|nr:hypothetical protein [Patescibacteria group bacterium]